MAVRKVSDVQLHEIAARLRRDATTIRAEAAQLGVHCTTIGWRLRKLLGDAHYYAMLGRNKPTPRARHLRKSIQLDGLSTPPPLPHGCEHPRMLADTDEIGRVTRWTCRDCSFVERVGQGIRARGLPRE